MSGANSMVDAEIALRTYLMGAEVMARLTGQSGDEIKIFTHGWNSDRENVPYTAIMIRDVGGQGDNYMELDKPFVQVWARATPGNVDTAKQLIARLDDELHRLGPKEISDDVRCLTMLRNTGKQRLDDPDSQAVQYFITYNTVMQRIA